ncbi:unnamed protein product [Rotaria sordida]|uniref:Uncharacterized protein n=1 Tax=Rotaria sordida TaxID=392033 RepID=A0A818L5K1_9BILA|nr:unnamed protein product [Rotaria sordida]
MEFKNVFIKLKTNNLLQLPLNQNQKQITVDPNKFQNFDVTLICYKIHLMKKNQNIFAYLFKNVNPTGIWYDMNIRDGDRLITLNGQDVTRLSYENVYSLIIEKKIPFTCEIVWHPELYIELETCINKNIEQEQDYSIISQASKISSDILKESFDYKTLIGINMYENLTYTLRYLFDYHPKEPYKLYKELSKKFYEKKQELSNNNQEESYLFAQRQLTFLSDYSIIQGNPDEIMTNILELSFLFEQIGIGLNKDEIYWIWLSMKVLLKEKSNIEKLRFWGKIFGIKNNYYILEADFDIFDDIDLNDSEFIKYQEIFSLEEENEFDNTIQNFNKKVPPEQIGDGINQKVFYVSIGINQPFIQLPMVTPEQIELSRRIQQFFTGDLEAPLIFESNFPGVEKHLLRAQIQRITAGTQIGPKNYFKISINEDEEEEEMSEEKIDQHQISFDINTEFEGNRLEDLALSHGQYWVHYVAYIYKQGRNVYFNQRDENQDEEKSTPRKISIEQGPHLLSSVSEDISIDGLYPAWSIGIGSTLVPEHALVYARSNRWPGAFTVGDRYRFKNIYIGWGMKNSLESYQANMIDVLPENEYKLQLIETDDPTTEEDIELFKSSVLLSPYEDEEFEGNIE